MVISFFILFDEDLNNIEIVVEYIMFLDFLFILYVFDRIFSELYWNILLYFI